MNWLKKAESSYGIRFVVIFAAFVGVSQWLSSSFQVSDRTDNADNGEELVVVAEPVVVAAEYRRPHWLEQQLIGLSYIPEPERPELVEVAPVYQDADFEHYVQNWEEYWRSGAWNISGCWVVSEEDIQYFLAIINESEFRPTLFQRISYDNRGIKRIATNVFHELSGIERAAPIAPGAPYSYFYDDGIFRFGSSRYWRRAGLNVLESGRFIPDELREGFLIREDELHYEAISCPSGG